MAKKILIVEDDKNIRFTTKMLLEKEGFETLEAEDGIEALVILENVPNLNSVIDLILSDVRMPKMDGIQLYEKVQKRFPKIPFIMMSAALKQNQESYIKQHSIKLVYKPFQPISILIKAVKEKINS